MSWNDDDLNTIRLFEKLGTINNVVQHVLAHSFGKNGLTPVHFEGNIIINNQKEKNIKTNYEYDFDITVKVLLDTGALCANYMSKNLYEDIRNQLNDHDIRQQKTCISLADDSKKITSDCAVTLTIDILDQKSSTNKLYKGEFVVINMRDNDVIIGLPAILSDLWEFFKTSIESNKRSLTHLHAIEEDDDLLEPWEHMDVTEAPEEEEAPLPVQFEFASTFLGMSREEAIQDYKNMFDEHIDPDFRANTNIDAVLLGKGLKVFVPHNWEGIKGIEPLKIEFDANFPKTIKPASRPVNPRLWDTAVKEFKRLLGYFYEKSRSPRASPLVIAPKATKPFIRFCGDYSPINKYLSTGHYTIPIIRHELDKIIGYQLFLDIDLTNAFHQIPLHPETSADLSIQTPWGQFQPKFMPEGIGPGSAILQETVRQLFGEFEWAIVIFDNILILAHDYADGMCKLDTFLDKCLQHNVILKFAKSWLGFKKVKFFGYECTHKTLRLTDDRKQALLDIPFPVDGNRCKKMRSLLGCGVMFSPFVANYSNAIANLTDMTKATFNWDEKTWAHDYRAQFHNFKETLQKACALYYPDYSLQWILRTDASDYGVGAVLIQLYVPDDGPAQYQPIAFYSKKFSAQAMKWTTIEKEGYIIFAAVKRFKYYLTGKEFIIETDHNNLRWMEASEVAKIIRWRIYLQAFAFKIRHIKGTDNSVADAFSRLLLLCHYLAEPHVPEPLADHFLLCLLGPLYELDEDTTPMMSLNAVFDQDTRPHFEVSNENKDLKMTLSDIFNAVHNAKEGHWGLKETWKRMNKHYAGHGASMLEVSDMISQCANCQKTRKERKDRLIPIIRTLKPPHSRSAIGIDALAITPHGKNGDTHIILIVNLYSKMVYLSPSSGCTANNLATAVWRYWCNFGCTDLVISDRGPDLTSQLFAELVTFVGMTHVFSIADRHVNGSERLIKETQRHLRALVYDTRISDVFSDPTIIPSIQYIMNSKVSLETDKTPLELTFGSHDVLYTDLLSQSAGHEPGHVLLQRLNQNLKDLRAVSDKYQDALIDSRLKANPTHVNQYQAGDYVTYDSGPKPHPKLSCRHKGPYRVVSQYKNDVECRNLVTDALVTFSLADLEPYFASSSDAAYDAALRDQDQYLVKAVLSYTGDSRRRTTMTFTIEFADGDIIPLPWSPDIEGDAYYHFCEQRPHLYHLTLDAKMAKRFQTQLRREDITSVKLGDIAYVDLRFFGDVWYEALGLPDFATASYVFAFTYSHWYHKTSKKKISGYVNLKPDITYSLDGYLVYCWGTRLDFDPATMTIVDAALCAQYPAILQD